MSATGWDDTTVHPVSAPVMISDRLVVYTADGGQLTLRAIDAASGATVWARPASVAQNTPGEPFEIANLGGTAFYYTPAGDPAQHVAEVVALDVATGQARWTSQHAIPYADMPKLCSDNTGLCVSAYTGQDSASEIRIDLATGAEVILSPIAGRSLGVGVWDGGVRDPEYIEHINNTTGVVSWKDPVVQLAGAPVSSDHGWNWDSYGDTYVGWLGSVPADSSSQILTLTHEQTIAVRASDGVRVWKTPGMYGCPVQGLTDNGQPFAVRCVIQGTATLNGSGPPTVKGLDVTIQGFNVHTGVTVWSDHVGDAPGVMGIGAPGLVRMNAEVFAVTDSAGRTTLINMRTGKTSATTPTMAGWCVQDSTYTLAAENRTDGSPADFSSGGLVAPWCRPARWARLRTGHRRATEPPQAVTTCGHRKTACTRSNSASPRPATFGPATLEAATRGPTTGRPD
jgi:hypothetical protein